MTQLADQLTAGDRGIPVRVLEGLTLSEGYSLAGATVELYAYTGPMLAPTWQLRKNLGADLTLDTETGELVWIPREADWANFPDEPAVVRVSLFVEVTLSGGEQQSRGGFYVNVRPDENRVR